MYLWSRLGARSCLFSFAAVVKVPVTGFIAVLLKNKLEQAWLVLPLLALGVSGGSGRGGVLAAPLQLAPEAGSDWLSKLKGCAWGFGWASSNNSLSRQGGWFPPWYSPWLRVHAGALLCALREQGCKIPWQVQISSSLSSQRGLDSRFKSRFLCN